MQISPYIWARDEVNRLLFDVVPTEIRHTVRLNELRPEYVYVEIHDGRTPRCPVKAVAFIDWLKRERPSYDQLTSIIRRKMQVADPGDLMDAAMRRNGLAIHSTLKQFKQQ